MGQCPGRDQISPMGRTNLALTWQRQSPWRSPEGLPCQKPRGVGQRSRARGHPGSQMREQGLRGPLPCSRARSSLLNNHPHEFSGDGWPELSRPHLRKAREAWPQRQPHFPPESVRAVSGHAACLQVPGGETRGPSWPSTRIHRGHSIRLPEAHDCGAHRGKPRGRQRATVTATVTAARDPKSRDPSEAESALGPHETQPPDPAQAVTHENRECGGPLSAPSARCCRTGRSDTPPVYAIAATAGVAGLHCSFECRHSRQRGAPPSSTPNGVQQCMLDPPGVSPVTTTPAPRFVSTQGLRGEPRREPPARMDSPPWGAARE